MSEAVDAARIETLLAMYRSVDRMNEATASGNEQVYQSEVHLQKNFRSNFEELREKD